MHRIIRGRKQAADPFNSRPSGVSSSTTQTHYSIARSINFAGTQTSSFIVSDNAAFAVYPVTVEAWLYSTTTGDFIIELQNPITGQYTVLGNQFVYQQAQSGGTSASSNLAPWTANAWHHVAFTLWSSTLSTTQADRVTWWIDGVSNGSTAGNTFIGGGVSPNYSATGESRLVLGTYQYSLTGSNTPFTGYISEVRVSNNARYGTLGVTFTPPAVAMTSDVNTLLLYKAP
jgi:hypothetical protein